MISLSGVTVDLGTHVLFGNASFLIQRGDRIGLVGRNGAGKSTMLGIITGARTASSGTIGKEKGITIGLLSQDLTLDVTKTLTETAELAFEHVLKIHDRIDELEHLLATRTDYESDEYMNLVQELSDAHEEYDRKGGTTMHADIDRILQGLGFQQTDFGKLLSEFSGGWQMRAELARLLLMRPDCLLLDEPTNHLDIESVRWLEDFLRSYEGAIVLVSHDRTFLDNVTNRTIEITRFRVWDEPVPYTRYVNLRTERLEQQKSAALNQQKEIERVQKFVDRFRAKASLASRVQSRIKQLEKMERIEVDEEDTASIRFVFPPAPRCGRVAVECIGLHKHYGTKHVLKGVDFALERGEKAAFLGRNGEGKSTLSKIIAGLEPATGGTFQLGHNVTVGYYAQHQAEMLGGHNTVLQVMENASPAEMRPRLRALLGCFLFSGDSVDKKVSVLSGGEKSRLALARLLLQPVNLLILDEPTNHLDMLAKEVLKQALLEYDGAMIVVSHDRDFLEGLTDKVIHFAHGKLREYLGDINDYLIAVDADKVAGRLDDALDTVAPTKPTTYAAAQTSPPASTVPQPSREEQRQQEREKKRAEKALAEAESRIASLESALAELDRQLADPDLYKDATRQQHVVAEHERIRQQLEAAWAALA
jgi:ATP-binding cassette subfamily F protein 3